MAMTFKKNRNCKSQIPTSIRIEVKNHNGNLVDYCFTSAGILYMQAMEEFKKKYDATKFTIQGIPSFSNY